MLELQSHLSNRENSSKRRKHDPIPPWGTCSLYSSWDTSERSVLWCQPWTSSSCRTHSWVLIQTQANLSSRMVILEQSHPWAPPVPWGSWVASATALVIASRRCCCSQRSQPDTAPSASGPSLTAALGGCLLLATSWLALLADQGCC